MRQRKRQRLIGYDYSLPGYYYVTICTKDREHFFGEIQNGMMCLNDTGQIAYQCWIDIQKHFPHIELDAFIIMPNHVHGIIIQNNDVGNKNFCSLPNELVLWQTKWGKTISSVIRGYKIGVTKWCRNNNYQNFGWQKSYYDHIIRNEEDLHRIRQYILNNPKKW